MPMRFAAGFLAIKAEHDDAFWVALCCKTDRASPRVAISFELSGRQLDCVKLSGHRMHREARAGKCLVDLFDVLFPPHTVNCKKRIGPRCYAVSGVCNNDASFLGRPRRFAPNADSLNIVGCKTWATGEADDSAPMPAASVGRLSASLVSSNTASPLSIKNFARIDETSTGTSFCKRPRSAVKTGFFETTMIFINLVLKKPPEGGFLGLPAFKL